MARVHLRIFTAPRFRSLRGHLDFSDTLYRDVYRS